LKVQFRTGLASLFLGLALLGAAFAHAQQNAPGNISPTGAPTSPVEKPDAPNDNDEFRHTPIVKSMAGMAHVSTETAAQVFEDLNSLILIGLILYFLLKVVPKAFSSRSETIQQQLTEARSATEAANQRLAAVEAKLATLGEDIDKIRRQTEADLLEDEKRIKQSLEDERVRIVKSAEQEIDSASAAAQRDLKRFAANLAIDKAVQRIQLTAESDRAIVERFSKDIISQFGNGGRN
jgi:F-type H+-transporting ATPase subunit b